MIMNTTFICLTIFLLASVAAFAPTTTYVSARIVPPTKPAVFMAEQESLEEEVDRLVSEEVTKTKVMSNLRNANGVEYAPWMKISKEDEANIRNMVKEKAEARRKRQLDQQDVVGMLLNDATNQELSGSGLRYKIVDGTSVELEWSTGSETTETKGFILKRRDAGSSDFAVMASYKNYPPLVSKGLEGATYRYLDEDVPPGGYVYRVTEMDGNVENDLSQCLVEVSTVEERRTQLLALAAFLTLAVGAVVAGVLFDPVQ